MQRELLILPIVKDRFNEWDAKGYNIILVSGRRESDRKITEEQLAYHGLFYDQLILGIGGGMRVLINDLKPTSSETTAYAIEIPRNRGLTDVNI